MLFRSFKVIHWEVAKGNELQNYDYCTKDYRAALDAGKQQLPELWCHGFRVPKFLYRSLWGWTWWVWENIVMKPSVERKIFWFYSRGGKKGKSSLIKAIAQRFQREMVILDGKASDSKYQVAQLALKGRYPKYILQDLSRQSGNSASYKAMEDISNGCFSSSKYESCTIVEVDIVPTIIVVSNTPPDLAQLSLDRWEVYNITDHGTLQQAFIPEDEGQKDPPQAECFVKRTIHCQELGVTGAVQEMS